MVKKKIGYETESIKTEVQSNFSARINIIPDTF